MLPHSLECVTMTDNLAAAESLWQKCTLPRPLLRLEAICLASINHIGSTQLLFADLDLEIYLFQHSLFLLIFVYTYLSRFWIYQLIWKL